MPKFQAVKILAICLAICAHAFVAQALAFAPSCLEVFGDQPTTRVVEIENFTDLRSQEAEVKFAGVSSNIGQLFNFSEYDGKLHGLGRKIRAAGFATEKIERVLYPMHGSDVNLAFRLFPNAKTVLAIDDHPLFSSDSLKTRTVQIESPISGAWRASVHIDMDRLTGPRILGTLLAMSPHARILHVRVTDTSKLEWLSWEKGQKTFSGEIIFDLGDGVGERRLIYWNAQVRPDNPEFYRKIDHFAPQALIAKATLRRLQTPGVHQPLMATLQKRGALIVEGLATDVVLAKSTTHYYPEFAQEERQSIVIDDKSPTVYSGARSRVMTDLPFGYRDALMVTQLPQAP